MVNICAAAGRVFTESSRSFADGAVGSFPALNSTHAALGKAHDAGSAEPDWAVGRMKTAGQAGGGAFGAGRQPIHVFRSYTSRKCTRRCVV